MRKLPIDLKNRPFTYKEAVKVGLSQYDLSTLIENDIIERVARGVYQSVDADLDEENLFYRAILITGKSSCICLLSALSYYDLTDIITKKTWVMTPHDKRVQNSDIKLFRSRKPYWNIGIKKHKHFSITTIERSIVDALVHSKLLPTRLGIDALKIALKDNRVTTTNILDLSIRLGVKHIVLPIVEVLA